MANYGVFVTVDPNQRTYPRENLAHTLWQILSSTGILVAAGVTVFVLLLCASLIRQMPGQIADDPAAATRWLLVVSDEYGILGGALRALGLFDVLHHPLLQLLLAVIALVLLVHLGNMTAALWRFWQVVHWVETPVAGVGEPVALPHTQPLYRLRQALSHAPQFVAEQIVQEIRSQFDEMITTTVNIPAFCASVTAETVTIESTAKEATPPESVDEFRLLARRHHQRWIWLRPLLIVGLLLALIAVWIILLAGWEVAPSLLAPGEEYRATTQRVTLAYRLPASEYGLTPSLSAEIGEALYQLPLGESQQLWLGQITIAANPGAPALLIRSADSATVLSRPGQAQQTADLGLIFPTLGSEDSVVVDNRVGLRIVRVPILAEADAKGNGVSSPVETPREQFLVEVYQSDKTKPVQTIHIHKQMQVKLKVGDETRTLLFIPLPSLAAQVRYQPGVWLLWLALLFVMGGAIGFRYQPAFLIIQVAPWPTNRSVVIAQSDVAAEIDRIRFYCAGGQ